MWLSLVTWPHESEPFSQRSLRNDNFAPIEIRAGVIHKSKRSWLARSKWNRDMFCFGTGCEKNIKIFKSWKCNKHIIFAD